MIGARKEYARKFKRLMPNSCQQVQPCDSIESERKIIIQFEGYIKRFIADVLKNDPQDPHYSAVTCRNCMQLILAYKKEKNQSGDIPYTNYLQTILDEAELEHFQKSLDEEIAKYGDRAVKL